MEWEEGLVTHTHTYGGCLTGLHDSINHAISQDKQGSVYRPQEGLDEPLAESSEI